MRKSSLRRLSGLTCLYSSLFSVEFDSKCFCVSGEAIVFLSEEERLPSVMLEAGLKLLCFNKLSIRARIVFILSTCSCLSDICFISHSRTSAACLISSSEKLDIPCLIWHKRYIVFSEGNVSYNFIRERTF